jgi:hypothetical protein
LEKGNFLQKPLGKKGKISQELKKGTDSLPNKIPVTGLWGLQGKNDLKIPLNPPL